MLPHKESFCGRAQNYRPAEHDIITNHKALSTAGQPQLHSAPFPNPKHTLLPFLSLSEIPPIFCITTRFLFPVTTRSHYLPKSCMKDFKDQLGQTNNTRYNTCFDCLVRTRAPYRSLFYIILFGSELLHRDAPILKVWITQIIH